MTVSQKQLEANRKNAKLGGPKTKAGKEISKYNALKHGLLAETLIIDKGYAEEDTNKFNALHNNLKKQLAPYGLLENILVEKMAVACWRLRRACRLEAKIFKGNPESALSKLSLNILKEEPTISTEQMNLLLKYEGVIERQFYRAMHQLERLQRLRAGQNIAAPLSVDIDVTSG